LRLVLYVDEPKAEGVFPELELLVNALALALPKFVDTPLGICNLIIIGEEYAAELNRTYRQKDYIPDCLSFPIDSGEGEEEDVLGEVYVCWQRLLTQAEEYGHSWQRECAWLMTHGILHLLGFSHGDEPSPDMRAVEEAVLKHLSLRR